MKYMTARGASTIALALATALSSLLSAQESSHSVTEPVGVQSSRAYYAATLAAAEKALRLDDVREARRWLNAAPSGQRGWEWSFVKGQIDESAMSVPVSGGQATDLQTSPDGKFLAVAHDSGKIHLLRRHDGHLIREIGDHTDAVYSIAFSPDGGHLASVSRDSSARVWEIESGRQISRLPLDNPGVAATTFSPDGKYIATCTWLMEGEPRSVYGVVWIWEAATGSVAHRRLVGVKPLDSIAWSADGQTLVVGSWDGLVHVLDDTGQERTVLAVPDEGIYRAVISVAIDSKGKLVAAGSKDRTVRVWRLDDFELAHTLRGHRGFVNAVGFSPREPTLATACDDSVVRLWNLHDPRREPVILHGHDRSVGSVVWSPNGKQVLTAARDATIRTWDADKSYGGGLRFNAGEDGTYSATFSPDGQHLYVATYGGHVLTLDAANGERVADFEAHAGSSCNFLSLDGSGTRLLTCSWDKTAKLWSLPGQELIRSFNAETGIYHCALSADGTRAALCTASTLQLWDAKSGERLGELAGHNGGVRAVAFDPRGRWLASASSDKTLGLWDLNTRERVLTLTGHESGLNSLAYSADGEQLASGDTAGQVILWRTQDGELLRRFHIGERPINRLSFTPDGKRLAAGSSGVAILDPRHSDPLLQFFPVPDTVWYLSFDPTGTRLSVCATGGQMAICAAGDGDRDTHDE